MKPTIKQYKYQIRSSKGEILTSRKTLREALEAWIYWSTTHHFLHPYKVGF